jgi:RNA polymerase sigma factor (sigma-70 family)
MTSDHQDEYTLVIGLKAGDPIIQKELVEKYAGRLLRFVQYDKGLSHHDGLEVVNDTLIKIIEKIDKFDPERGRFLSWMLKIAQNTAKDKIRALNRKPEHSLDALEDAGMQFSNGVLMNEECPETESFILSKKILKKAFQALKQRDQRLLLEGAVYGQPHKITAESLGIEENAAKVAYCRAKKKLKLEYISIVQAMNDERALKELSSHL